MKSIITAFAAFTIVMLVGCASGLREGNQYVPQTLSAELNAQLATLQVDGSVRRVEVDGVPVTHRTIKLVPGSHKVTFEVYGETDEWREINRLMAAEGFSPSGSGEFSRRQGYSVTTAQPIGVSRYGWNSRKRDFTVGEGDTVVLSQLK